MTAQDGLAARALAHVEALCSFGPDRFPGTPANDSAVGYVVEALGSAGCDIELLPFQVVGWTRNGASICAGDLSIEAHPGPFSAPFSGSGALVVASTAEEITAIERPGAVLLLNGPVADAQLTPRDYPWYSNPAHAEILADIDRAKPLAVVAATGRNPAMAGAISPFPLIEDPSFELPHAYISLDEGQALGAHAGKDARVSIESARFSASGTQPVARIRGDGEGRILVCAHVDTKPGTQGALDNAAGVAVVLLVAELLAAEQPLGTTTELVAFNGEDHAASPGEVAYLSAHPDTSDIKLVINIDGVGSRGGPALVSRYNPTRATDVVVDRVLADSSGVAEGEPWFASDHAVFAMRGVSCLALTSHDAERLAETVLHTELDTVELVDARGVADTARFVAGVVRELANPATHG